MTKFLTIIFLSLVVSIGGLSQQLDRDALKQRAEIEGFGYKLANLEELSKLVDTSETYGPYKFGAYRVLVPRFVGISSHEIQAQLKKYIDVADGWGRIIDQYLSTPEQKSTAFEKRAFPPEFLKAVAEFRNEISQKFPKDIAAQIKSAQTFLEQHRADRLMVRSSGKEDTDKLANAGGNDSIANVIADTEHVSLAMRDVFISIFGDRSLIQRLFAKDESLFDKQPFTPMLLQVMIGETNAKAPSKCGVMFTEDAEGGISRYKLLDDKGGIKTTGITLIQAAYGHNEAVVNSQIPVDTYYVDDASRIYPAIRYKTYRKVPTQKSGELVMAKNPDDIIASRALNDEAVLTLKSFARSLESFYQGPMDVEFVVDEQVKTIYIVQARPIVHSDKLPRPTYLKDVEKLSGSLKGTSIGVAGGAVRVCTKSQSVVQADINKALGAYQERDNPENINCVIVGKDAPATSHEATSFRADVKPVMFVRDWEQVRDLLDAGNTLVMSPQQHVVGKWQSKTHDLKPELADGWVSYPAPPALSFPPLAEKEIVTVDKNAILALVPRLTSLWPTFIKNAARYDTKKLFEELTGDDVVRAELALASLLYQMSEALAASRVDVKLTPQQIIRLHSLQTHALQLAHAIKDNLKTANDVRARLLLPVHALKTLFYQIHEPNEIVDGESVLDLSSRELLVEQELTRKLAARNVVLKHSENLQLFKLGELALTKDLEEKWFEFVVKLDQGEDVALSKQVKNLIRDLGKLDLLSPWLNVEFAKDQSVSDLIFDFDYSRKNLERILEYRNMTDAIQISAFSDEKGFLSQWRSLQNILDNYFLNDGGITTAATWTEAFSLERLAMLALMRRFVDKFDLSIKEVKTTKNLERFREMTRRYVSFSKAVWDLRAKLIPPREASIVHESKFTSLSNVVERANLGDAEFSFSQEFNAEQYVNTVSVSGLLGPTRIEEVFGAAHQYLLKSQSGLGIFAGLDKIEYPALVNKMVKRLKIVKDPEKLSRIGSELGNGTLEIFYNYSFNWHSLQYSFFYDKQHPDSVVLRVNYGGLNLRNRWNLMADFFGEKMSTRFAVSDIKAAHHYLTFSIKVSESSVLDLLNDVFLKVEDFTFSPEKFEPLDKIASSLVEEDLEALVKKVREGTSVRMWQAEKLVSHAIIHGDAKMLEDLLASYPQIDLNKHVSSDALSALTSDLPGLERIIRLLVKFNLSGAKVDNAGKQFYIKVLELDYFPILIEFNVDLNSAFNSTGKNLLHWAVEQKNDRYVKMLAEAKNLSVTSVYRGGEPLDMICGFTGVEMKVVEKARILIKLGALVRKSCLAAVIRTKNQAMMTFLVEERLLNKKLFFENENYSSFIKTNILNLVEFSSFPMMLELYLDNGNGRFSSGDGLLHFAIKNDSKALLTAVLQNPAAYVDIVDDEKNTPLHLAVLLDKLEFTRALIKRGADVKRKDNGGKTVKDYFKSDEMTKIIDEVN